MKAKFAARLAGYIHELHRIRLPLTGRMVLPLNVKALERHLVDIHEVFGQLGIAFWLRDGTALGVYRNGGIIPQDDDVDLGIWNADSAKIEMALKLLCERGFTIYARSQEIICLLKDWETVEIIVSGVSRESETAINQRYLAIQESYFSDLAPLRFLERDFLAPREIEGYLEFSYGSDWRTPKPMDYWSNSWWLEQDEKRAVVEKHAGGEHM